LQPLHACQPLSKSHPGEYLLSSQVIFYDYAHCKEFLEGHNRQLKSSVTGLDRLGLYRPLYYCFSNEALESGNITIAQFDQGVVFLFIPEDCQGSAMPRTQALARAKALELLKCKKAPMVLELQWARSAGPLAAKAAPEHWMRKEFLSDMIESRKMEVKMYFDGETFFANVATPLLAQHGFRMIDDYETAARAGYLKVKHPKARGKHYKLPWLQWIREMLTGGYSTAYVIACFVSSLGRLSTAVEAPDSSKAG
jgi:hypothetical protein